MPLENKKHIKAITFHCAGKLTSAIITLDQLLAVFTAILCCAFVLSEGACITAQCRVRTYIPPSIFQNEPNPSVYPFSHSGLQIFTDLNISCSGQLVAWKFIARTQLYYGLNLAVFRIKSSEIAELVGVTMLDKISTGITVGIPAWVTYNVKTPIPVKAGDVLGFYYNTLATDSQLLTIPTQQFSTSQQQSVPALFSSPDSTQPSTLVLNIDGNTINNNHMAISVTSAQRVTRIPALAAVIEPKEASGVDEPAEPSPYNPVDYLPGFCKFNPTSPSSYIPTNFVAEPVEKFKYRPVEASLQIFMRLEIPCTGFLTKWLFISGDQQVNGLHLAVFQFTGLDAIRLVNQNVFDKVPTSKNTWVTLGANPIIPVYKGDVIGFFYDTSAVGSGAVSVPWQDINSRNNANDVAYVISSGASPSFQVNTKIDLGKAVRYGRIPALSAVVEYLDKPPVLKPQSQCSGDLVLPPEFGRALPEPKVFPVFDAGLQIFTYMEVPCQGWLTEWNFIVNNAIGVSGLHLGVFRALGRTTVYELIGDTVVTLAPAPNSTTKLAWIKQNAEPCIAVKSGDLIGMFYEDPSTKQVAVPNQRVARSAQRGTPMLPTYVYLMNWRQLCQALGSVDVSKGGPDFRKAGLAAVINGTVISKKQVVETTTPAETTTVTTSQQTTTSTTKTSQQETTTTTQVEMRVESTATETDIRGPPITEAPEPPVLNLPATNAPIAAPTPQLTSPTKLQRTSKAITAGVITTTTKAKTKLTRPSSTTAQSTTTSENVLPQADYSPSSKEGDDESGELTNLIIDLIRQTKAPPTTPAVVGRQVTATMQLTTKKPGDQGQNQVVMYLEPPRDTDYYLWTVRARTTTTPSADNWELIWFLVPRCPAGIEIPAECNGLRLPVANSLFQWSCRLVMTVNSCYLEPQFFYIRNLLSYMVK